jgi:hypothetical protein
MQQLPRDRWRYRVQGVDVADLSDRDRLSRIRLMLPTPGRRTWPPYQGVGETLWNEGWRGLLAPSAARPQGLVLCLFIEDPNVLPARPVGRPKVVAEPPVLPSGMRT